ncbi:MAG TPA: vitamin B12-dependent ribonucleotide reductase, partial [Solirubrobacterales bacterium]|nr:vitamin B12-dependent ribonucleotide reductase [Solirubrobacterales bacterium]
IPFAKSMPDYIMRWLASRFIDDTETLEELGIMTQEVRNKKEAETSQLGLGIATDTAGPANGNGRSNGGNGNGGAVAPTAAMTEEPPVRPAKMQGLELGPACEQCGGMMQRTGSCYTCPSCGNNTGCG